MIHFGLKWYGTVWFDVVWCGMVRLSCGVVQFDVVRLVPYVMMYIRRGIVLHGMVGATIV